MPSIEAFAINDLKPIGNECEIADPHKLAGLFNMFVTKAKKYRKDGVYLFEQDGNQSEIFYVLHLPETFFNCASGYEDDDIHNWFEVNWNKSFVITSPIYTDVIESPTQRYAPRCTPSGGICSINNSTSIETDLLRLRQHNCYTVCSGLTIAIALHRAGRIRARLLRNLLQRPLTYSMYEPSLKPYYDNHILPMVADVPYHYSLRDSDISVIRHMQALVVPYVSITGRFICGGVITEVYTTPAQIIFKAMTLDKMKLFIEYWPGTRRDRRESPDFIGLVKGLCNASKGLWHWWKRPDCGRRTLERLITNNRGGDRYLYMLILMYITYSSNLRMRHRLVVIWRQLLSICMPLVIAAEFDIGGHVPHCVVPLLMDILHQWPDYFAKIAPSLPDGVADIIDIKRRIEHRRRDGKLICLKRVLSHEVFDIMTDFYKRNKTLF